LSLDDCAAGLKALLELEDGKPNAVLLLDPSKLSLSEWAVGDCLDWWMRHSLDSYDSLTAVRFSPSERVPNNRDPKPPKLDSPMLGPPPPMEGGPDLFMRSRGAQILRAKVLSDDKPVGMRTLRYILPG